MSDYVVTIEATYRSRMRHQIIVRDARDEAHARQTAEANFGVAVFDYADLDDVIETVHRVDHAVVGVRPERREGGS